MPAQPFRRTFHSFPNYFNQRRLQTRPGLGRRLRGKGLPAGTATLLQAPRLTWRQTVCWEECGGFLLSLFLGGRTGFGLRFWGGVQRAIIKICMVTINNRYSVHFLDTPFPLSCWIKFNLENSGYFLVGGPSSFVRVT